MENCLFCSIAAGAIPSNKVYEDDKVLVFKDINPQADVHLIAIPKQHYTDIAQFSGVNSSADTSSIGSQAATDSEGCRSVAVGEFIAKVSEIAKREAGDFKLLFNTGAKAGQTVFHVHGHILGGVISGTI
ncbi:histidine triad nucleotide-binding protein [Actinomycetota bacterium]|nr:histidine triad nucleotide-binding protein [Actinomycetota bacterium]